jgi:alkanesulfonate monooxygenase SsuD/methylene tetrahydromethanopterin reductase-like flavin-dependent oxidoreductase (luciferase family)
LWTDEIIEHHGTHFNFDQVAFEPKPFTKPHPPIIVGGDGPAALRRAATIGQGWIPMNHSLEQLPASIAKINEIRAAAGITEKCEITMGGGPVTSLDDVKRCREFGIDRMLISPWKSSREAMDGIKEFAETILGPSLDI